MVGKDPRNELAIQRLIDGYNHNMNGVDIFDQYRSYYSTHPISYRTGLPLFFWLLDTSVVSVYIIYQSASKTADGKVLKHKDFCLGLVWSLITTGILETRPTSTPPPQRHDPGMHLPKFVETRLICSLYHLKA